MAVGDIKAGRAYVEVGTDNKGLDSGLRNAQARVMGFGTKLKDVSVGMAALGGAAIVAGAAVSKWLVGGLTSAVERASTFVDMADRLGASVEGLEKLAFGGGRLGVEIESINIAMQKMQKNLGNGTISKELRAIGLEVESLKDLKADEAFLRVVDALRSISDQNEQAAATTKIFGRSGADLQGIIKEGSESMRQMAREGQALGVIMGEDLARGFEQAGDAADDAAKSIEGLWNQKWFQERIAAYADLVSEIVTLGDAQTEFFNSQQIKIDKYNAKQKQALIDQENAIKFTEAQTEAAKEQAAAADATASRMADELATMEAMLGPAKDVLDIMKKRQKLMDDGRKIFETTRTPEENYKQEADRARDVFRGGGIDRDTYLRRIKQLLDGLPRQIASTSTSAAGTFNPFAVQGLGDNERLTKAAEETAKNTKKLADNANKGMVFV
jgi:hypothetical protein